MARTGDHEAEEEREAVLGGVGEPDEARGGGPGPLQAAGVSGAPVLLIPSDSSTASRALGSAGDSNLTSTSKKVLFKFLLFPIFNFIISTILSLFKFISKLYNKALNILVIVLRVTINILIKLLKDTLRGIALETISIIKVLIILYLIYLSLKSLFLIGVQDLSDKYTNWFY